MNEPNEQAGLKDLFLAVVDLPDDASRRALLQARGVCEATASLVLNLVTRDRTVPPMPPEPGTTTPHTSVAALVPPMPARDEGPELAPGDRLGSWTLLQPLGQGGMGRVYLAERSDGLYQQQVAVKLLRGRADAAAQALLARERQILASLNHPHIARLIDGGTTPRGRPYLVMELVRGERIDRWCQARGLGLLARLQLFEQVCEAVAQAHRQLVVHCDLKPANVLVTDDGRAMLLDFGIARLDEAGLALAGSGGSAAQGGRSEAGTTQGLTPRYASPEQQAGHPATAASDTYSLGRLLDELLSASPDAGHRRREWRALVERASAPDPAARYRDVPSLLSDLRRFHRHLPLQALSGVQGYALAKLLRRRWAWALMGAGGALLVGVFTQQLLIERDRARQAEALAREEAQATQQVTDLLVGLFEGADPAVAGQAEIGAAALVDRGRERVVAELAGRPELLARMQGVLGRVYDQMGRPQAAISLLEAAVAQERKLGRHVQEARLLSRLAMVRTNGSESGLAVAPARRALDLLEPAVAAAPADGDLVLALAEALDTLGHVLSRTGAYDEAQRHLERALALRRAQLGSTHLKIAFTLHHLGILQAARGAPEAAEQLFRDALRMKQQLLAPPHPTLLNTQQHLAMLLAERRQLDQAEALLRDILQQRRLLFGPRAAPVGTSLNELAGVLQDSGRLAEAIALYREALAIEEAAHGPASTSPALVINNLATALEDAGDPAAEAAYRSSLARRRARLGEDDLMVARAEHNLGRWLLRQGRDAEAGPLLDQAAATRAARLPASHGDRVDLELTRAELDLRQGRLEQAAARVAQQAVHEPALRPQRRVALLRAQGLLLAAQGDAHGALARARQAADLAQRTWAPGHRAQLRLAVELAAAEAAAGQAQVARQLLQARATDLATLPADAALRRQANAVLVGARPARLSAASTRGLP